MNARSRHLAGNGDSQGSGHDGRLDTAIRLDALRALSLFNANPDERFDRLTRLAKRVFNVSAAKVTLVAPDMAHTVSCAGEQRTSIPRELSFC